MNPRLSLGLLAALGCLGVLLGGCATAPAPQAPRDTTKFTVGSTDRFAALDAASAAAVDCTGLQERTLPDGRLEVIANLKNRQGAPARVQIRCEFLDDQGTALGPGTRWQVLALAGGATEVVTFTAPGAAARMYAIRVRTVR